MTDEVPRSQRDIQELLARVTAFQKDASRQDADVPESVDGPRSASSTDQQIESLLDDALAPHPPPRRLVSDRVIDGLVSRDQDGTGLDQLTAIS